jgi:hypothetical protein
MKKKTILLTLCSALVLIGTSAFYTPLHHYIEKSSMRGVRGEREFFESKEEREREREGGEEAETDGPAELLGMEREITMDPETGRVPTERLYAAMDYYTKQQKGRANYKSTSGVLSAISWQERGASNVGGRTRALIFDKNDATNKAVFAGSVGGGLWKCNDITATTPSWTAVNDQFANLSITCIAQNPTSPQIMYFGTGEGYFNTDAIKGGGIWKSTNGGVTWTRLTSTNNDNFAYIQRLAVTSTGDVYAATRSDASSANGGLMKSTDGGSTWTAVIGTGASVATDTRVSDIEIAANGDLYASVGLFTTGKVFRASKATYGTSVGDDYTWTNISPTGSFQRIEIACAPNDSNQVYLLCQGSSSPYDCTAIFSSSTKGASWTTRTPPTIIDQGANSVFTRTQGWYNLACAVDPNNSQTLYIAGIDALKSTNAGSTFSQITTWSLYAAPSSFGSAQNTHADIHTIVFRPGYSTTALMGSDGGVVYSSNLTSTGSLPSWTSKNNGYNVTQYYSTAAHPTNSNYFLAGAQDNGTQAFTLPGLNATSSVTGGDGANCWIDKNNGNNQIAAYLYNNFYVSTNGGASFSTLPGGSNNGRVINPGDLDGINDVLYTCGGANYYVRWTNVFGTVARTHPTANLNGYPATAIRVSPNNPTTIYIGNGVGDVFLVTNANGATPTTTQLASSLGPNGNVMSIAVWKSTSGIDDSIAVVLSNYGVNSIYLTGNATATTPTWSDIDDNNTLQDIPVRSVVFNPLDHNNLYIGTEVGVLSNSNLNGGSTTWTLINNSSLPMVRTDQLTINSSNQLVAATHGRGLFTTSSPLVAMPLPIHLTAFDAVKSGQAVSLNWDVQEDNDATGYEIERMYDGESTFTRIQHISAQGFSSYQATDNTALWNKGAIYYRIRCLTSDGNAFYSSVRKVTGTSTTAATFINAAFPTVTDDMVHIEAGNNGAARMEVFLNTSDGKVMMHQSLPYGSTDIHLSSYPAGSYYLIVVDDLGKQKYVTRILRK